MLFLIFLGCILQGEGQEKNRLSVGSIIYFKIILDRGTIVAVIYGSWIYNYLCNRCISPLMLLI